MCSKSTVEGSNGATGKKHGTNARGTMEELRPDKGVRSFRCGEPGINASSVEKPAEDYLSFQGLLPLVRGIL